MIHDIKERRSPAAVILVCSCGWKTEISRKQNALARHAKVEAAKADHLSQIREMRIQDEILAAQRAISSGTRND